MPSDTGGANTVNDDQPVRASRRSKTSLLRTCADCEQSYLAVESYEHVCTKKGSGTGDQRSTKAERNAAENDVSEKDEVLYPCTKCGKDFATIKHLYRHQVTCKDVASSGPIQCDKCHRFFQTPRGRQLHQCISSNTIISVIPSDLTCNACNEQFGKVEEYIQHRKECQSIVRPVEFDSNSKTFQCDNCNRQFKCMSSFSRHGCQLSRQYDCDECGRPFQRFDSYRRHVSTQHVKNADHMCGACGTAFKNTSLLSKHMCRSTAVNSTQALQCPIVNCSHYLRTYVHLCNHVTHMHGHQAEVKQIMFADEEGFEDWRLMMQEDYLTCWRVLYRRDSQHGGSLQQFVCNRSGKPQIRSGGKRANWSKGYVRLNRACTSFCHAKTFTNGKVHVEYCTAHTHAIEETSASRPCVATVNSDGTLSVDLQHGNRNVKRDIKVENIVVDVDTALNEATNEEIDVTSADEKKIKKDVDFAVTVAVAPEGFKSQSHKRNHQEHRFASEWIMTQEHNMKQQMLNSGENGDIDVRRLIVIGDSNTFTVPSFENEYEAYIVLKVRSKCAEECRMRCGYHQCNQLCLCLMSCSCRDGSFYQDTFACRHIHAVNILFNVSQNGEEAEKLHDDVIDVTMDDENLSQSSTQIIDSTMLVQYDSAHLAPDNATLLHSKLDRLRPLLEHLSQMVGRHEQEWAVDSMPLLATINRNITKLLEINGYEIITTTQPTD